MATTVREMPQFCGSEDIAFGMSSGISGATQAAFADFGVSAGCVGCCE